MYIIFASYGNDSVALIQWAYEQQLQDVTVLYSDTGWASSEWRTRVDEGERWVRGLGFTPARTASEGFEELIRRKKTFPRGGMQFCTSFLKIQPALDWLDTYDPDKNATCMVGIRREESAHRRNFPLRMDSSPNHGGRALEAPLAAFTQEQRDALLARAGFTPLPHRSKECFPCVHANRKDLRALAGDEERIAQIERVEEDLSRDSGATRTMFKPRQHMGATGIRQIIRWAESERGKFTLDDGTGNDCDTGYCGT